MNCKDKDGNPVRVKLKEVQAEKDLGVTIDKVLSVKRHVEMATSKANRVIGVIRRSFDYLLLHYLLLHYLLLHYLLLLTAIFV